MYVYERKKTFKVDYSLVKVCLENLLIDQMTQEDKFPFNFLLASRMHNIGRRTIRPKPV